MAHHRDARRDQFLDLVQHPVAALELDRVRAGLLQEPGRRGQRLLRRALVRAERQVSHDQRPASAPDHRGGQRDQLVQGHRDRAVVPVHDHRRRVADQQHGDAGVVEDPRGQRVVRGQHRPLLAAGLGRRQIAHRDPAGRLPAVQPFTPDSRSAAWSRPCRSHQQLPSSGPPRLEALLRRPRAIPIITRQTLPQQRPAARSGQ